MISTSISLFYLKLPLRVFSMFLIILYQSNLRVKKIYNTNFVNRMYRMSKHHHFVVL
ncbi:NAD-dependent histone deacetylase HST3 [Bienertia sinuspersici]